MQTTLPGKKGSHTGKCTEVCRPWPLIKCATVAYMFLSKIPLFNGKISIIQCNSTHIFHGRTSELFVTKRSSPMGFVLVLEMNFVISTYIMIWGVVLKQVLGLSQIVIENNTEIHHRKKLCCISNVTFFHFTILME